MGQPGLELHRDLGHQGQRPLGAHDELGQVETARRLDELSPGPDHLASGQDRLEAQHVVPGHPVTDGPHPPAFVLTLPPSEALDSPGATG